MLLALLWGLFGLQLKPAKPTPIRPYVAPVLEAEPPIGRAPVTTVEVLPENGDWDANVFARPVYTAPLVGNIARGTRVRVRGQVEFSFAPYCATSIYYALEPFGWLCSADSEPTDLPPTRESVLNLVPGSSVPYVYVMVTVEEGSFLPMWASEQSLMAHEEPERQLGRGDTIALAPPPSTLEFEGVKYFITIDGKILPTEGTFGLKKFSEWQGVQLSPSEHFPFAWVTPHKAPVYDAPKGKKLEELPRRTRVDIVGEQGEGRDRWVQIGEGRFMKAVQLNEVRKSARPPEAGLHTQWIDVDLGEQVVVAYAGELPVYATLTSSGREPNHTPRGNYPVWGKATAITMKSQAYDDAPYYVNRVPWVMFFQAHNALHAAYWHDRFGAVKSHGCANLSPLDARYLFDWLEPPLPPGWTSVRYWNLEQAPVVHVRNSERTKKPIFQERNVGPPDKNDEAERLAAAVARREAAEREEALRAAQAPTPLLPNPLNPASPMVPSIITPQLPLAPLR
ncbi:MAG: L,D-transpeptidase [Myxococcales bacterium]